MADEQEILNRWRLVLGKYAADQIPFEGGSLKMMEMEEVLDYLYSREYGEEQEIREDRKGGSGASQLTVPHWLTKIKTLFPRNTVEIMERHALEKYQMTELLTDPEVLRRLEPNKELLKTVMQLKHMMKGEVLTLAREVVRKVADELTKKLEQGMKKSFSGRLNRSVSSPVKSIRNIDIMVMRSPSVLLSMLPAISSIGSLWRMASIMRRLCICSSVSRSCALNSFSLWYWNTMNIPTSPQHRSSTVRSTLEWNESLILPAISVS